MKYLSRVLVCLSLIMGLNSCLNELMDNNMPKDAIASYTAYMDTPSTKTVLDGYISKWNGEEWIQIGTKNYRMIFDYRRFFMGTKFGIFNYATKKTGGYVDVDYFKYSCEEK